MSIPLQITSQSIHWVWILNPDLLKIEDLVRLEILICWTPCHLYVLFTYQGCWDWQSSTIMAYSLELMVCSAPLVWVVIMSSHVVQIVCQSMWLVYMYMSWELEALSCHLVLGQPPAATESNMPGELPLLHDVFDFNKAFIYHRIYLSGR